ncbi:UNKNOWN [Stylonychia lemnae]|uniref:Transmembrane protein n=1 Tax=Stylonychia lemnae TaxID=5949 RepID=A0A078B7S9_STYLE|nr:UNKNOWN [Stylonychia lemnae]|eukprot:CDW89347.1 UNKNOWN [Stylonychia lemnae]
MVIQEYEAAQKELDDYEKQSDDLEQSCDRLQSKILFSTKNQSDSSKDFESLSLNPDQKSRRQKIDEIIYSQIKSMCNDPFNKEDLIIRDSYTQFKIDYFAKFLFYHILYFLVLGPFTYFILRIFETKQLLINMGFYGLSRSNLMQTIQWLTLIIPMYLHIFQNERGQLSKAMLIVALVQIFLRSMIVAVRYATTVSSTLKIQQDRILTRNELESEWISTGWMDIKPDLLDKEIKCCMIRNEVENVFFKIKFFTKINNDAKKKLLDYNFVRERTYDVKKERQMYQQNLKLFIQESNKQTLKSSNRSEQHIVQVENEMSIRLTQLEAPNKQDLYTQYPGRLVFREMFLKIKHFVTPYSIIHFIPVRFLHSILPLMIELQEDYTAENVDKINQKYLDYSFWVHNVLLLFFNTYMWSLNIYFLAMGNQDMKRRLVAMHQCEANLEPNRYKIKERFRNFTLINYFDAKSLLSWMDMRMMYLDLGQRFFIRFKAFATIYLIFYSLVGGLFLAWYFVLHEQHNIQQSLILTVGLDLIVVFIFLYELFNVGSKINDISNNHLLRLSEIKSIMQRILQEWDYSINSQETKEALLNNTYRDAFLYFQYKIEDVGEKWGKRMIKQSMNAIDTIQERLQKEIEFNPITILGIPLTMTIMNVIRTSFISLIFAMINFKLKII